MCCTAAAHAFLLSDTPAVPPTGVLQIRLDTMLRLSAIKWLCFLFQETDHLMRAPGHRWAAGCSGHALRSRLLDVPSASLRAGRAPRRPLARQPS